MKEVERPSLEALLRVTCMDREAVTDSGESVVVGAKELLLEGER